MSFWVEENSLGIGAVTNYGEMGQIGYNANVMPLILNNFGIIGEKTDASISAKNNASVLIQNYALRITENMGTFSTAKSGSSHLVIDNNSGQGNVSFKDSDSKIILDFGGDFEFGAKYLISKIAIDKSGNPYDALGVDFDRLTLKNDIYTLTQSGQYFIAKLTPQYGIIGTLHKANVRTMNNFITMSNAMIYPRKYNFVILRERSDRRISKNISSLRASEYERGNPQNSALDSANHLKSYESFSYRNKAMNRRIQRQNKRNYSRESLKTQNLRQLQNLNTDSANRTRESQNQTQNLAQNPHDYYFILTPFINYNSFAESGRYNLSGFDYGFLTAFSAKVAESNSLGAHFMMSYGNLGDKQDKDLSIKSLNLNLGLNYKLDLVWDMFVKARGDFYYFLNQAKTLTMFEAIKPNNLGFGASVSYGKEWDFREGGMLGIEVGLDYKALKTNEVSLNSQTYKQSLYNLIYADFGVNYAKYFGGFGINLGTGFRANLAPKLAESALLINTQTLKFTLDNDKYLGYANAGISYALNAKSFDMEFSLAYYGNFGDRAISNAGGFEWRVGW